MENIKENKIPKIKKVKKIKDTREKHNSGMNLSNVLVILRINLRMAYRNPGAIVTGILFICFSLLMGSLPIMIQAVSKGVSPSVTWPMFQVFGYIVGGFFLGLHVTLVSLLLFKTQKNTGIHNIETRAGIHPIITFLLRYVIALIVIYTYVTIFFCIMSLLSLSLNVDSTTRNSVFISSYSFNYLFGFLFLAIALITFQICSSAIGTFLSLIWLFAMVMGPLFSSIALLVGVKEYQVLDQFNLFNIKEYIAQGVYKDLNNKYTESLLDDVDFFEIINNNIDKHDKKQFENEQNNPNIHNYFDDNENENGDEPIWQPRTVDFNVFNSDSNIFENPHSEYLIDWFWFAINSGTYDLHIGDDYIFKGTEIFKYLEEMKNELIKNNYKYQGEDRFVYDENPNRNNANEYMDISDALNLIKKNNKLKPIANAIENSFEKLKTYDSLSSDRYSYSNNIAIFNNKIFLPYFRYNNRVLNGPKIESDLKKEQPIMREIAFVLFYIYKGLYDYSNIENINYPYQKGWKKTTAIVNDTNNKITRINRFNLMNHMSFLMKASEPYHFYISTTESAFSLNSAKPLEYYKMKTDEHSYQLLGNKYGYNPNNNLIWDGVPFKDSTSKEDLITNLVDGGLKKGVDAKGLMAFYILFAMSLVGFSYLIFVRKSRI